MEFPDMRLRGAVTPGAPCPAHKPPSVSPRPLSSQNLPHRAQQSPSLQQLTASLLPGQLPADSVWDTRVEGSYKEPEGRLHTDMSRVPVLGAYRWCHRPTPPAVYLSS